MMATPFFYMFSLTFFTWEWYNKTEHIMQEKTMTLKKLPTGVQDILPRECRVLMNVRERLTRAFEARGYDPVLSAAVEYYDTYAGIRNALEQERMFKFTDSDGRLLVLRPDATLSISRIAATKLQEKHARLYYFLDKWDAQNGGGVKSREIIQAGVERLGEEGAFSDAQTIAFAIDCMRETGLSDCIVDIGHVGFMKGLLEECGLSDLQAEEVRASLNSKDGLNAERLLRNAGAKEETLSAVRALPTLFGGAEVFARAKQLTKNARALSAIEHLEQVHRILSDMGYERSICFDLGTGKSLSYYSGIVFSGLVREVGASILSGGRYDGLADDFGKHIPAVGFAIGLKRVLVALERQGNLPAQPVADVAVACEEGAEGEADALCKQLIAEGKRVTLAAEYGKEALSEIDAVKKCYVTKKVVLSV